MSASAAVWNGRFGAFGIVSVTLGSLRRWRKVCQKRVVKSNLLPRLLAGAGARWGSRGPRGMRPLPRCGWAPSGHASSAAALRERVPSTPTAPPPPRATGALAIFVSERPIRAGRGFRRRPAGLEIEGFEVGAELVGQVGTGQGELDGGLEEAELVARVVAAALELEGIHGAAGPEGAKGVSQLDLAPR